jgi:hypothetical protein
MAVSGRFRYYRASSRCHDRCTTNDRFARSEFRFGRSSVFGQLNPFRLFDLSASRSQSPITWLGIRSVSVTAKWGHRKSVWILRLSDAMATSAWDSESLGRRFESFQAHHFHRKHRVMALRPGDRNPLVCHVAGPNRRPIVTTRPTSPGWVSGGGKLPG